MSNPTSTRLTNFSVAKKVQFQHPAHTNVHPTVSFTVLCASSFFSHPHWPLLCYLGCVLVNCACVVAGNTVKQ